MPHPTQLDTLPNESGALLQTAIEDKRIAALYSDFAALKKTPRNSSLLSSTQDSHSKPVPQKEKSCRKQGGRLGHPKQERSPIPTEQFPNVVTVNPKSCRGCRGRLTGEDSARQLRQQVSRDAGQENLQAEER